MNTFHMHNIFYLGVDSPGPRLRGRQDDRSKMKQTLRRKSVKEVGQ